MKVYRTLAVAAACWVGGAAQAAALHVDAADSCLVPAATLQVTEPGARHQFGNAIAIDGQWMAVGAPYANQTLGPTTGAVYMFERVAGRWVQRQRLQPGAGAQNGQRFGYLVALRGDVLVASAEDSPTAPYFTGVVFVFRRLAGAWAQEAQLHPAPIVGREEFGSGLAFDGEDVVVGAWGQPLLTSSPGAVHVFRRAAGAWSLVETLQPANSTPFARFGQPVVIRGDLMVVGAIQDSEQFGPLGPKSTGAAFVYRRVESGWVQEAKLVPASPVVPHFFGFELTTDGARIVVSSDEPMTSEALPDPLATREGVVYVFERVGPTWVQTARLTRALSGSTPYHRAGFGSALHLAGDRLHVGAFVANTTGRAPGALLAFERSGGDWRERWLHAPGAGAASSGFGGRIVGDGDSLYVSAVWERQDTVGGVVHRFERIAHPTDVYCTGKPSSLGCVPAIAFEGAPSVGAVAGLRVRCTDALNQRSGSLLFSSGPRAALPFHGGTLCLSAPLLLTPSASAGGSPPPAQDCSGSLLFDLNAYVATYPGSPLAVLVRPGRTLRCQWLLRDRGLSPPDDVGLSNALEFTVCL